MSKFFSNDDKALIIKLYGLNSAQVFESEKLYVRSSFSVCASAKIIKNRKSKKL
jgi:hypothetical protein